MHSKDRNIVNFQDMCSVCMTNSNNEITVNCIMKFSALLKLLDDVEQLSPPHQF